MTVDHDVQITGRENDKRGSSGRMSIHHRLLSRGDTCKNYSVVDKVRAVLE